MSQAGCGFDRPSPSTLVAQSINLFVWSLSSRSWRGAAEILLPRPAVCVRRFIRVWALNVAHHWLLAVGPRRYPVARTAADFGCWHLAGWAGRYG
jgi:hypothetical protein